MDGSVKHSWQLDGIALQSLRCFGAGLCRGRAETQHPASEQMYILALFLAVLGLHRYVRAFSSHCEWELLSSARASHCNDFCCGAWALGMETSVAAARGLQSGLSSCGTWASLPQSTWDVTRPGMEPVSPELAGGFLTTVDQQGGPEQIF